MLDRLKMEIWRKGELKLFVKLLIQMVVNVRLDQQIEITWYETSKGYLTFFQIVKIRSLCNRIEKKHWLVKCKTTFRNLPWVIDLMDKAGENWKKNLEKLFFSLTNHQGICTWSIFDRKKNTLNFVDNELVHG